MGCIQLEFNIDEKITLEKKIEILQKQFSQHELSSNSVRKKLFAENSELKNKCAEMSIQITELKELLLRITNEQINWAYGQEGCLFNAQKY